MDSPNALTLNEKLDFIIKQLRAMRKELQSLDVMLAEDEPDQEPDVFKMMGMGSPYDHEPNMYESQRDKMREAGHKESDF